MTSNTVENRVSGASRLWTAALPWLPFVLAVVGWMIFGSSGASDHPSRAFVLLVVLTLAGTLAALHRPGGGGGSLALGLLVVPLAVHALGIGPAMMVAAVATWASGRGRSLMRRRASGGLHEGAVARPWGLLDQASASACATLVAGLAALRWVDVGATPLDPRWLAPPLLYAATWLGARALTAQRRPNHPVAPTLASLVDLAGWWLGTVLASLVVGQGWLQVAPVFVALVALGAEAGRVAFLRGVSDGRVADFERLQLAHQRILAEISGMGGIAAQIMIECANVLPVHTFHLAIVDPSGKRRSFVASPDRSLTEGEPAPPPKPPPLPGIHRRTSWRVIEHALVLESPESSSAEPRSAEALSTEQPGYSGPGPAPRDDEMLLGTLTLWCDPRRVDAGSEELLATLIPHMASALQRARLDREAKLDPLTELPVRRVLDSRLQQVYQRCFEAGQAMAVVLCDIDHFKRINDTHGHDAGDHALVAVARALDGARRDTDLCCRYGGEEFTVLLEATAGDDALQLAERLRAAVEAIDCRYDGQSIPLRLSAGVASFPELHVKTASELLLLADEALYAAKETGRNRCLLHLGHGRYRSVDGVECRHGDDTGANGASAGPTLPRIFG